MAFWNRLSRVFRELRSSDPLNNPAIPLSSAGFLAWLANGEPTAAGEIVNETTALQQNSVYSCVRVIAGDCASLPCRLFQITGSGRKQETEHDLAQLLRYEPNAEMTAFTFWESIVGSLALTGNGYAEIQRQPYTAKVLGLWPLHPRLTTPKRVNDELVYETTDGEMNGRVRTIKSADMLHIPLFSFSGLYGFSPIALARQGIGLARAAERFGGRFFGNGARPSGVLSNQTEMDPKQIRDMKDTWKQMVGGENNGGIAVLPGNWTYQQIGISPEDSQFLQTRNYQRTEIAALMGVPPHRIGDTSRMSNNNAEQQNLGYVIDTLRVYLSRIEQEIKRKLLPRTERDTGLVVAEFDVSERLRGDFKTTMEGFAVGKQWGFFSTNYIRRKLGENPIGQLGDVYCVPLNMKNADLLLTTDLDQAQQGQL
ncbi:MAG: phage portal protein [Bryobacteraceae bacterium]